MIKKIGILGSGQVAKTLGDGFIRHGFSVMLGTRDPNKLTEWQSSSANKAVGSFNQAAAYGQLLVLAVKGTVVNDVLARLDEDHLSGKTIIDATNPISNDPPEKGVLKFTTSLEYSLMEQLQSQYARANFVKAFNSVGSALMVNPQFSTAPTMFICGNSTDAKREVIEILHMFGWEVEDFGGAESARAIEPLCILWCIPGFLENRWDHAFKLLKSHA